ncbi:MAG: SusC/RagA family TonB-linked outer membrane protein [Phocaeicola sp.]
MRKQILLFFLFALLGVQFGFSQGYTVKGTVLSHDGKEPLIGATVLQTGSTNGVVTDFDGNYTIQMSGNSEVTLRFSYIGMKSEDHQVSAKTGVLNVVMHSDSEMVDEVVVVAYGVRKKGTIAGSVSTVKSDKLESVPAAGFDQALQGQTAGLTVLSESGEPSKAATFQIRGTNSINSGTSPLFILDGVPISSSDFNTISPSDIESVSVLKDASSTSIYGARAANGVIVITTKRGKIAEKARVTVRTQLGYSQLAGGNWNLMNTAERIQYEKEVGLSAGQDYNKLAKTDVNWLKMVFNDKAPLQSYDLSISGANERTNYYISAGFYDQDGIAQNSSFSRYNVRTNVETKANNWLKVGTNSMLTYEEISQADEGSYTLYTPISASRFMLPYWDPYNEDGSIASQNDGTWKGQGMNPIEWMNNNPYSSKKYKALSTLYAEIAPLEGLTIRSQLGLDYSHTTVFTQSMPSYLPNNNNGMAGRNSNVGLNLTISNTANYRFSVKDFHSFNFMLGQEGVKYEAEGFFVQTRGQNNDALTNLSTGTRASSWGDNFTSYAYLSFFGRGEYNFDDRYYADFSLRTDGSSRFGRNGRWASFWSVGFMWNMRQEEFMKKYNSWLTNAQLTFSTGTSGNSSIPNYEHLDLVSGGLIYNGESGLAPVQLGNPDLGWEKLWTTNVGLRLGFFNRLNVVTEVYHKNTSNMLMQVPISYAEGGFGFRWDNVGAMVNQGVEFSLDADVIRTKNFSWNLSVNASYNHNKITELYNGLDEFEMGRTNTKLVVGRSVGEFYMNRYAGVNPANGDPLWYDKNGNVTNEFREEDKVMMDKNYIAPWQGGFGTALSWKGFHLSAQFSWVADRWVINNDRYFEESNGLYTGYNQSRRLLYDRWKNPGDITDIPRHGVTPQFDTHLLENASFLRLKNLMLSYSFDQKWLQKTKFLTSARLYVQGQNLLTFTGFSGLDPENSSNIYSAQYPASRQYSLGVELSF